MARKANDSPAETKTPKVRKMRQPTQKTTAAEAVAAAGTAATEPARITNFKRDGASSAAVPSAEVSTGFGPVELHSAEDSLRVLAELANLNDKAAIDKKRWEELRNLIPPAQDPTLAQDGQETALGAPSGDEPPNEACDATEGADALQTAPAALGEPMPEPPVTVPDDDVPF